MSGSDKYIAEDSRYDSIWGETFPDKNDSKKVAAAKKKADKDMQAYQKEKKRRESSKEVKKVAKVKKTKIFTVEEKVRHHEARVNSSDVTKNQKAYSRFWLEGFRDPHADQNLKATKSELKQRKALIKERQEDIKVIKDGNNTVYAGYINGAKAGIKKK